MLKRYQILVTGPNVQRCGFRKEAARIAREMGLSGQAAYVGKDILIEVEGDEEKLRTFMDWCKTGPEYCEITRTVETEKKFLGETRFIIMHGVETNLELTYQKSAFKNFTTIETHA